MVKNAQVMFTASQYKLFQDFNKSRAKFFIVPKGRRYGFTSAAMSYILGAVLQHKHDLILWGDTINANIDRYVDRMLIPKCRELGIQPIWEKQRRQFRVKGSNTIVDFRGADRPENWEGFGYDLVVLNEAGIILQDEYLWENAVKPMLIDNTRSRALISGTPKGKMHKGREAVFYRLFKHGQDEFMPHYYARTVTTYDNPMLSRENIDILTQDMPSNVIEQEINGKFIDISNNLVKREWVNYFDTIPPNLIITMGVDLAISQKETADSTAIVVSGKDNDGHYYVLDAAHGRWTFHEQAQMIEKLYHKWQPKQILIEQVQYQTALIQELVRTYHLPARGIVPKKDKVTRALPMLAKLEQGLIKFYKHLDREFENEVISFPDSKHDDFVDALVYSIELENIIRVRV